MDLSVTTSRLMEIRRRTVAPIASAYGIELLPDTLFTAPPMVLLLGNHSSGKSSMVNHLLGTKVQRTGVAPTDDAFTVLFHADEECTLDGQALTTSPDLPLGELNRFGPGLVHHLAGRGLDVELLRHVRLIDSPGMIDGGAAEAQRPYDFPAVVRWFAEQADLVLLFFDPEKPGTTGETLTTLTESLAGIDHKLRIVMNKMDLFDGLRDFARTYGALCWNLSRNLPTKDLPHIYTTVIPELVRDNAHLPLDGFAAALLELERYIADLPERRADTVLSRSIDESRQLLMRATVTEALRNHVGHQRNLTLLTAAIIGLGLAIAGYVMFEYQMGLLWTFGMIIGALLAVVLGAWLAKMVASLSERLSRNRLDEFYQKAYRPQLVNQDHVEDLHHDWQHARPAITRALTGVSLAGLKRVKRKEIRALQHAVTTELPGLRHRGG